MSVPQTLSLLIAALGGEGGGVLTQWIVSTARSANLPVQSTSIPGVAQRTGATTYYIEMLSEPLTSDRAPVFALTPFPGRIDAVVASEILEAGRAMQNGYVTPERTTLIGSVHRTFAISERTAMGDGRYDAEKILNAALELARRTVLFDMKKETEASGSIISAVLLGAIAGARILPIGRDKFEQAIRASGLAVEVNLKGFAAGYDVADATSGIPQLREPSKRLHRKTKRADTLFDRVTANYPADTWSVIKEGVHRLVDYQDPTYATLYLDRLDEVWALIAADERRANFHTLLTELARHLAIWMAYDDIIRVADLKTRKGRYERIATEVRASPEQPVIVTDHFKPGLEELAAILPPKLAGAILNWAVARNSLDRMRIGLHIKSTSVLGFLLVWILGRLRIVRRRSSRYVGEQDLIERWLSAVKSTAPHNPDLAKEVIECARLIKGYGETHRRSRGNFLRLMDSVVNSSGTAADITRVRKAALADPDGGDFEQALAEVAEQLKAEVIPKA